MKKSPRFHRIAMSLLLVLLAPGLGPIPSASSAVSVDPNTIRITADQQIYDLEKKRYALTGNVTVAFQNILLKGSKADMILNASGQPQMAQFYNRPTFLRIEKPAQGKLAGEDRVVGDTIRLHLDSDSFGAEGNVESYITTVAADPFIIRSDVQQFDSVSKSMAAKGNVLVDYKGSKASSQAADVRMKPDGKAERVVFSGGARLKQENSEMSGGRITVMVDSGNLIAESNVKTRVDLVGGGQTPQKVIITSDYQQYDKSSDMMIASGNVRIVYGDYIASGTKATFRMNEGQLDRIFLTGGRPTITEKGRTITADKITITTNPRNFDAVGNVKVQLQSMGNKPASGGGGGGSASGGGKPAAGSKLPDDEQFDY